METNKEDIKTMEKERLKFCIERFDHYYDSINNKCAVFLAFGTFTVGGLVAAYPYFSDQIQSNFWLDINLFFLIAIGLSIMIIVSIVSTPFISSKINSNIYFKSIAEKNLNSFLENSKLTSEEEELNDLRIQVHQLSQGLVKKFKKLKWVGILIIVQLILFIPLIILLLKNTK